MCIDVYSICYLIKSMNICCIHTWQNLQYHTPVIVYNAWCAVKMYEKLSSSRIYIKMRFLIFVNFRQFSGKYCGSMKLWIDMVCVSDNVHQSSKLMLMIVMIKWHRVVDVVSTDLASMMLRCSDLSSSAKPGRSFSKKSTVNEVQPRPAPTITYRESRSARHWSADQSSSLTDLFTLPGRWPRTSFCYRSLSTPFVSSFVIFSLPPSAGR